MDIFDGILLVVALTGLIAMPLMMIRSLMRGADAPAKRSGDGWVLTTSPASYYAAGLLMCGPLGVLARISMGRHEPGFALTNPGPLAGLIAGGAATALALFLVIRARLRTIRYDAEGVTAMGRRHLWSDLTAAGIARRDVRIVTALGFPHAAAVARFRDGGQVIARADMEGQGDYIAFLREMAKRNGVRWGMAGFRKRGAHA